MRRMVLAIVCLILLLGCTGTPKPKNPTPSPEATAIPEKSPEPTPSPSPTPHSGPKVKTIRIPILVKESRFVDKDRLDQYSTYSYDNASGRLLGKQVFDGQRVAPLSRFVYEYDAAGLVTLETQFGSERAARSKIAYKYDTAGRKTEENRIDESGLVLMSSRYSYDGAGKKTHWKIFLGGESLAAETIYEYTNDQVSRIVLKGGRGEYLSGINITRDKKGREVKRVNITVRGIIESFEDYEYDGDHLSKEIKTGPSGKVLLSVQYEYQGSSAVLSKKTIRNAAGKVKEFTTYEYAYKEVEVPLE